MRRWTTFIAPVVALVVVGGASGLGTTQAHAQYASKPAVTQASPSSESDTEEQDGEEQDGTEAEGTEHDGEEQSAEQDAAEQAKLREQATITEQQARDTALAANPGATVTAIDLANEYNTVVYDVELSTGVDVKVDATSGQIIATEQVDDGADAEQGGVEQPDAPTKP